MEEQFGICNKIFPGKIKVSPPGFVGRDERYQYQYPIILRYLKNKIAGWSVADFFEGTEVKKVALYAVTEFMELVLDDIEDGEGRICVPYLCDRNPKKFKEGYKGHFVVGRDVLVEAYQSGDIDKIMICSIFHVNEIFDDLMKKGIRLEDMISVSSVIFSV